MRPPVIAHSTPKLSPRYNNSQQSTGGKTKCEEKRAGINCNIIHRSPTAEDRQPRHDAKREENEGHEDIDAVYHCAIRLSQVANGWSISSMTGHVIIDRGENHGSRMTISVRVARKSP
jgi:hypothetical protein